MTPPRVLLPSPALTHALVVLVALAAGCRGCGAGGTVSARGVVELDPSSLTFPLRTVGASPEQQAVVRNLGRAPLRVTWSVLAEPFSAEGLPEVLPPGDTVFTVRFRPTQAGHFTATLEAQPEGEPPVRLSLLADAREVPRCADPGPCLVARFDVETESCHSRPLPDETPCPGASECLREAGCRAGLCVGDARKCDDGNACTTDVCNPLVGCESLPAPPCPTPQGTEPDAEDGVCQMSVCDPKLGCTVRRVADGTVCRGGSTACDGADICVSGECTRQAAPDGFVCAEASPCQGQGVCLAQVCERPPARQVTWDFMRDTRGEAGDGPGGRNTLHEFWMDEEGRMTLAGWPYGTPVLDATEPTRAVVATSRARRCLLWEGRHACGDFPAENARGRPEAGLVSVLDAATGAPRWTFSLREARLDLAQAFVSNLNLLFVTRVASLGRDRLLALYEGYPVETPQGELGRRRYVAAVLDANGALVGATLLSDPLLDRSDHPHPFGLAADRVGNSYVAFSPVASSPDLDGLTPASPTLLVSFNPEGRLRWKQTYDFTGGELAVGSGLLLPERAGEAYSTTDGLRMGAVEGPGRVGIAPGRVVLPPVEGGLTLSAVTAPMLGPAWEAPYTLPEGHTFSTRRLALARWQPRREVDRLVALGVARSRPPLAESSVLVAVELEGGREAFVCRLQEPDLGGDRLGEVHRLHVSGERLGVMDATTTQGEDPPFAYGQARFTRYRVEGLTDAPVAWSGEFGGPDHDQQEDPPPLPAPTPTP